MNKWLKIAGWAGLIVITLIFLQAGALKLIGEQRTVAGFNQLGYPEWFRVAIGMLEIIGGAALLFRNYSRYGAAVLAAIMIGAIISVLVIGQASDVIMPAFMLCILVVIGAIRKPIRRNASTKKKSRKTLDG